MLIRKAVKDDAKELLSVFQKLDSETQFMLYEPGERKTTIDQQERIITSFNETTSKLMLLAVDDDTDEIAGFIVGIGNTLSRNKHSVYCVIGLIQKFTGQGIGKRLLKELESWVKQNQLHRIELTVMENNQRAISLYKSSGFEIEGVKRDSLKVNGEFINELYMSKLIYT